MITDASVAIPITNKRFMFLSPGRVAATSNKFPKPAWFLAWGLFRKQHGWTALVPLFAQVIDPANFVAALTMLLTRLLGKRPHSLLHGSLHGSLRV